MVVKTKYAAYLKLPADEGIICKKNSNKASILVVAIKKHW